MLQGLNIVAAWADQLADVAMHLNCGSFWMVIMVPCVHSYHLCQPINVERVMASDATHLVYVGQCVMSMRSPRILSFRVDFRKECLDVISALLVKRIRKKLDAVGNLEASSRSLVESVPSAEHGHSRCRRKPTARKYDDFLALCGELDERGE
eukprot:363965-Chlamydomonas_euryale.AAC.3